MTPTYIPTPAIELSAAERHRFQRACERGYLLDVGYATPTSGAFQLSCWERCHPVIVAHPWRRHWYAVDVALSCGKYVTSEGKSKLNALSAEVIDPAFGVGVGWLPGGVKLYGVRPEAVESLLQTVLYVLDEPGNVIEP